MSLSPEELRFIAEYTASVIGKINQVLANRITTTFTNSNDVIPSSKLVKDEFAAVRSEIPTNTSDLTNDGADGTNVFIVEGDSRLTDIRNPKPHNQASSTITDTNTYQYINNSLQNQASINAAINEKIGALMNLDIIEQVSTRPTASAETMNKIYLIPEATGASEDMFQVFITVYENNAYKWEKIDTARIDISGKQDKIDNSLSTTAKTIVGAINEIFSNMNNKQDKTDNSLNTSDKTVVGAINSLNSNKQDKTDNLLNTSDKTIVGAINLIKNSLDEKVDINQLSNYVQKSSTNGLIRNDGTIDTNQYLTSDNVPESFNYGYVDSNLVLHLICVDGEVTATNSIIQSGDSNTLTAVITDKENNPLEGMPVEFLVNGVKYGQTVNSNAYGIATCSYVGTGAGEIDVQVRVGNFLSEIYETFDCILKDMATQSNHNDAMWTVAKGQLNRGTEDTNVEINSGQTSTQAYFNLTNTDSFVIEFDAMFDGSSNLVQLRDSNWHVLDYVRGSNYNKDTWYAIKIEVKNGQSIITVSNTQQTPKTLTGISMFMFALTSSDNYFKFKNFKYYPI